MIFKLIDLISYMRYCREVKKEIIKAKNKSWEIRCKLVEENIDRHKAIEAWRISKVLSTEKKINCSNKLNIA